ncbi:MAG: response regulator [Endomicrobiia bacterium]
MERNIFVVEDEQDIAKLVSHHLEKEKYKVKIFNEGTTFLRNLNKEKPDLIILDLMLPDIDGFEICKILKSDQKTSDIPIIMLTAKGEETDKIIGLELGADDYVTKPFSVRELVSRVKAVLKRTMNISLEKSSKSFTKDIVFKEIKLNKEKFEVFVNDKRVYLTTTEFKILEMFLSHPGRVFSRENILDYLWGTDKAVIDRTVDVHIKNLREKLKPAGRYIVNIRGIGYKLEE